MKSMIQTPKPRVSREGRRYEKKGRGPGKFVINEGTSQGEFRGSVLSLSDLEIPTKKLLTRQEERTLGLKIQNGFRRLAKLLPETITGYRRYLQQMAEVNSGAVTLVVWFPIRDQIEGDLLKATKRFTCAERLARRSQKRADHVLRQGVKILKKYPLDPENRFQWSRLVAHHAPEQSTLAVLSRPQKALRILKRTIAIMEAARDRLVLPNFRLILKEVFRYQPSGMKRSDLFQEGILGLHRAVFRFDPSRLTRFSTYATYWIRQAIRKALIDRSRLIRVPQAVQEELRNPDTHLSSEEIQRVRRIMRETVSISAGDDDDPDDRLSLEMISDKTTSVNEKLHTGAIPVAVSHAMTYLDSREREVIRRRFGLEGEHIQTLEEIGSSLHLSRERIRQIETDALKKMRRVQTLQDVYDDLEGEVEEEA
jgi:RNA polymerase sigma factor (sigma-70 family)